MPITLTDLPVTGTIPDYLDGRYLRNGPNPVGELDPALYHWFSGDGMVHGVRIRDGAAQWYRNRWVRGPATSAALGEEPLVRAPGVGANTNVIGPAGRTLALVEADGLRLRRRERPQRAGDPRYRNPRDGREHPAAASRARGFPRQLDSVEVGAHRLVCVPLHTCRRCIADISLMASSEDEPEGGTVMEHMENMPMGGRGFRRGPRPGGRDQFRRPPPSTRWGARRPGGARPRAPPGGAGRRANPAAAPTGHSDSSCRPA